MNHSLQVQAIPTRIFRVGESLAQFVHQQVPAELVQEQMVIAVTSKIVSLAEKRLVDRSALSKAELVRREADHNFGEVAYGCFLTVKHGLFIPSAGIDESNSEQDQFILYPEDPFASARALWQALRERWGLRELGILLTDSHTTPLRRGVTGISLAHCGFGGLTDLIGAPDLFGRRMQMTTVNVADGLAAAATLMMGEANEARPLAVIRHPGLSFAAETNPEEVRMPLEQDLYYPFFRDRLLR